MTVQVQPLSILMDVEHITADKMYNTDAIYQTLEKYFPDAQIIIPPKDNTFAECPIATELPDHIQRQVN